MNNSTSFSRSMNGLNDITADDISADTISAETLNINSIDVASLTTPLILGNPSLTLVGSYVDITANTSDITLNSQNGIKLNLSSAPNALYLDFSSQTGGSTATYDTRIYSNGGTGTTGQGILNFFSGGNTFNSYVTVPTETAGSNNTRAATTAFVTNALSGYASLSGANAFTGINTFNVNLPRSNLLPSLPSEFITKYYFDQELAGFASLSGSNAFTGTNTYNVNLPTSTLTPTLSTELVTKDYVDTATAGGVTLAGTNAWTGTNSFDVNLPTSTLTPTLSTEFVTKTYQDTIVNPLVTKTTGISYTAGPPAATTISGRLYLDSGNFRFYKNPVLDALNIETMYSTGSVIFRFPTNQDIILDRFGLSFTNTGLGPTQSYTTGGADMSYQSSSAIFQNTQAGQPVVLRNLDSGGTTTRDFVVNYNDVNFNGRTLTNATLPTSIIGVKAMCRLNFAAATPFYTMVNHFGFLLIPPANTTYVSYRGVGRITIYVNITTGVSAAFQVIAQGSYNGDTTATAGPTTMLISNPVKGTLSYLGSVVARSLDLTFTRTTAPATLTNLVANGFIDVTIIG